MTKSRINYGKIDYNVRTLVRRLNEIPFIATQSICEGHLRDDSGWTGFLPDDGHKFLYGGDVIFSVDKNHERARRFLTDVKDLETRYGFVDLHVHHCRSDGCSIEGSRVLDLDYSDLTHSETILEGDTLEVMIKKRHQVAIPVGEQRIREYGLVWSDLLNIANRY